jgi:pyrroline-5-carboxylate reductase
MNQSVSFIGGGNMGAALIRGLIAKGLPPASITVGEPLAERRDTLAREFGVRVTGDNREATRDADVVVLAVKPQDMAATVQSFAALIRPRAPLVLSIAAGIRVEDIQRWCGTGVPVVRAMPNRPALNGAGATAIYAPPGLADANRDLAEQVLGASGTTVWVRDEHSLDVVTALSGSGPAYFFLLAELMTDAAVGLGLERDSARELAIQTLYGSGCMARASDGDLQRLRAEVTSRGGTTEAAVRSFDTAKLRDIVAAALKAATDRAGELAQGFGKTQK